MNTYINNNLTPIAEKVVIERIQNKDGEFISISYHIPRSKIKKRVLIRVEDFPYRKYP